MPIELDEIRKNAAAQGISLSEIAVLYEDLTEAEMQELDARGLITHRTGNGSCLGRFTEDGNVLFQEKATGVHYLGA